MSGVSEGSALTIAFQIEASVGRSPGASSTSWARVPTIFCLPGREILDIAVCRYVTGVLYLIGKTSHSQSRPQERADALTDTRARGRGKIDAMLEGAG